MPDHSTLSRTRQRLPLEVHQAVFALILGIVETKGLLKGRVLGVDSTYLRADASMKDIVRRDTKESYLEFVTRLAEEAGVPSPTAEDARRLDRKRKGKKTSNRGVRRASICCAPQLFRGILAPSLGTHYAINPNDRQ